MALDTRAKRSSAIHIGKPWRGLLPEADNQIDQADRQQLAMLYTGVLAGGPVPPPLADQDLVLPGIISGMAISEVGLCNMALVLVGEEPILSLTEDTKPARFCNQHYDNIRDYVLRQNPWNVATRRAALSLNSVTPTFEFTNAFQLPDDFMRLLKIENRLLDFRLEEDKLLSNEGSINIVYIFRLTDVSKMDPLMQQAIAALLASEIAIPIAQNIELHSRLRALYQEKLAEARLQDSLEGPIEVIESTRWVRARSSGFEDLLQRRITPVP